MGELLDFQGIANYGIYWQRDGVNWWPRRRGGEVRLLGKEQRAARQHLDNVTGAVDFSNQRGIYLPLPRPRSDVCRTHGEERQRPRAVLPFEMAS